MKSVMIIDDDENLRKLYQDELTDEGYSVVCCKDMDEANMFLNDNPNFDLIVLDIMINGENCLEKLETLRVDYPDTKIILNSGFPKYKMDFKSWLADSFLVKSPDLTELFTTIGSYLNNVPPLTGKRNNRR